MVSGGGRGVTAACVVEWARRSGARFLVLGWSRLEVEPACCEGVADEARLKLALLALADAAGVRPAPLELSRQPSAVVAGREIRTTLEAVTRAGGQARYFSVDVQNPGEVAAALESARQDWVPPWFLLRLRRRRLQLGGGRGSVFSTLALRCSLRQVVVPCSSSGPRDPGTRCEWVLDTPVRAAKKPEDDPAVDENPNGGNRTWIVTLAPWREVFARVGGWERQIPGV